MHLDDTGWERRRSGGQFFIGVLIVGAGVYFLLQSLGVPIPRFGWPLFLVALGVFLWVQHGFGSFLGNVLVAVGGLFLLRRLHVLPVDVVSLWPLLLIAVGLRVVWHGVGPRRPPPRVELGTSDSELNESAAFGGGDRKLSSPDFKGGRVSVAFGGFDIDLKECAIKDGEAVIEVMAAFGGVDFKVPATWNVALKVASIFGGCDDKTVHPADPASPRLVVTGSTVFGGIEIGN
jgi:predicted membrane protein